MKQAEQHSIDTAASQSRAAAKIAREDKAIYRAVKIVESRMKAAGPSMTDAGMVKRWLLLNLSWREQEVFSVIFLDTKHQVIEARDLFFGTIDGASVYPREVARQALELNAAAVIFAHNHPSGIPDPSKADKILTHRLRSALALLEIRVLDHLIIGKGGRFVSFADMGLM